MDIQLVINQMVVLFTFITIGYISGKIKILTPDGINTLSKVVMNISMPAMILNSVLGEKTSITGDKTAYFMLLVLLTYAIYFLLAIPSGRLLGANKGLGLREQRLGDKGIRVQSGQRDCSVVPKLQNNSGLYTTMIVFGNIGFMGFPVLNAIFVAEALLYGALFNVVFNLLLYSVGIILISGKSRSVSFKLLLNATLIAALASFIIVLTGLHAPSIVTDILGLASGMNTPGAMIVIGASLSQIPFREVFGKWQLYVVTLAKMIIVPIVTWFVFKQFVTDEMILGVLTVLSGMPIAAVIAVIPIEYGGDDRTASGGVFLTTLFSAVTIPLIVYLLLM